MSVGSTSTDSTNCGSKILKIFQKVSKAKCEFAMCWPLFTRNSCCIYNYSRSIYIVLGIISDLEMT